jgi:hypothetical protein
MATGRDGDLQGLHYLKHGAAALGIPLAELVDRAQTYRCLSCGNYFCDPWFSPELSASLFCASAPDHLFAWGAFENWLHRRPPYETRNERLYAGVLQRVGTIECYAEFGCPFQGFLMQWKGYELVPARRIDLFAQSLYREPDVRWSRITRIYNLLQRWVGRVAVLALRVRGLLVRLAVAAHTIRAHRPRIDADAHRLVDIASLPSRRYLLTRDTSIGWGSNCVRFGASCRYFAHKVLGATVLPMHEVHGSNSYRFDLIGIFNSLDHTAFPMDVVRQSLQMADHVLLVTHHAKHAGKQHLFAFSDEFMGWLAKSLPDISAEYLQSSADPGEQNGNYILLSRRKEPR